MTVQDRVTNIVCEHLAVERAEAGPTAKLCDDLGADSLDALEIVMAIEECFDIEISDEQAQEWKTVGDVIKYAEKHGKLP